MSAIDVNTFMLQSFNVSINSFLEITSPGIMTGNFAIQQARKMQGSKNNAYIKAWVHLAPANNKDAFSETDDEVY